MPSMQGVRWWVVAALGGTIVLAAVSIAVAGGGSRSWAEGSIHDTCEMSIGPEWGDRAGPDRGSGNRGRPSPRGQRHRECSG
jgi:hypothetical protein